MTMIERVAEVFRKANESGQQFAYEDVARAAIEAMREPTQAMDDACTEEALGYYTDGPDLSAVWRVMIDAALTPEA